MKGRSRCYVSTLVEHSQRRENVIDRDRSRVVELLLQLNNKQHNVETQHKHMYLLYIGSFCNVAFPMTSQVFVEI